MNMKSPLASKINIAALLLVFLPQLLEILRGSPLFADVPRFEEIVTLIGAILILILRTFFTAEATTLTTKTTLKNAEHARIAKVYDYGPRV
jgi:hypothetical protein